MICIGRKQKITLDTFNAHQNDISNYHFNFSLKPVDTNVTGENSQEGSMSWKSPFIVYRFTKDNKVEEVFHTDDIVKAKYWIAYIAEAGDVLARTPAHPKYAGNKSTPEYWSHKESSGKAVSNERKWKHFLSKKKHDGFKFPNMEMGQEEAAAETQASNSPT